MLFTLKPLFNEFVFVLQNMFISLGLICYCYHVQGHMMIVKQNICNRNIWYYILNTYNSSARVYVTDLDFLNSWTDFYHIFCVNGLLDELYLQSDQV